jgi:hypothetical protein
MLKSCVSDKYRGVRRSADVPHLQKWQGSGTWVSLAPILPKDFRNFFCFKQGKVPSPKQLFKHSTRDHGARHCILETQLPRKTSLLRCINTYTYHLYIALACRSVSMRYPYGGNVQLWISFLAPETDPIIAIPQNREGGCR